MYINDAHESLLPVDETTQIWRYIDLPKLVSMLDSKSLFFSRIDRLGDPLEGRVTKANADALSRSDDPMMTSQLYRAYEFMRLSFFANCWHMSEIESAGMWQAYTGMHAGIAILTDVSKLIRSVSLDDRIIRISKTKYIDRRSDAIDLGNMFNLALTKGSYYSYENELRMFHWFLEGKGPEQQGEEMPEFGMNIRVDLDVLIEKIVVSPLAPQWFFDAVKSLCYAYNLRGIAEKVCFSEMKEEAFS